jgi:pyruvate dehydrogenase E2 component (dihydrolipoamide acetyltransferase)
MSAQILARVARSVHVLSKSGQWWYLEALVPQRHFRRCFAAASAELPPHIKLRMPALSPTMKEGNLVNWVKKEGEQVSAGDVLAEIETDKATVEFESQDEGILAKILVPAGTQNVPVGTLIALLAEEEADVAKLREAPIEPGESEAASAKKLETPAPEQQPAEETPRAPAEARTVTAHGGGPAKPRTEASRNETSSASSRATPEPDSRRAHVDASRHAADSTAAQRLKASPYARKLAEESGVDLSRVQGSGPDGRIVAADLEAALRTATRQTVQQLPLDLFVESKRTIPHYQLVSEVRLDSAQAWLTALQKKQERSTDDALELEDFLVKALATAAQRVPSVNASFMGSSIREYANVNVLVLPSDPNSMYRVIPNAQAIGLREIHRIRTGGGSEQTRENDATDLGTIGFSLNTHVLQEMAIIIPPHAAIVVFGKPDQRVIAGSNGTFEIGTFALVTASFDHRVVDGAVGAQFMAHLAEYTRDPLSMLE